jgi:hypothetical protein
MVPGSGQGVGCFNICGELYKITTIYDRIPLKSNAPAGLFTKHLQGQLFLTIFYSDFILRISQAIRQ